MADIDFELITPSAAEANDAVLVRRGASAPNSGALIAVSDFAAASHTHTTGDITGLSEAAQDAVGAMVDASLTYVDATPLLQRAALTGDVTASAGSNATTIAADAVTYAKMQNVSAASKLLGRGDSGSGDVQEITLGANLTMTGTTLSAAGGSGSPGGSSGEVQYNNAGAFAGAADVEIEGGQLRLPAISMPTAPAAGGVKLFGRDLAGRILPAIIGPSGIDTSLQPLLGSNRVSMFLPNGNATTSTQWGSVYATTGTATTANVSGTNRFTRMKGLEYLVTVAATTAVVGFRGNANQWWIGGTNPGDGGFFSIMRWGPATGVATATTRAFAGMRATATPTDVEPSTLLNICGMGWDAADTNIQFMHNDGSGTATKIDLGASFPVPTADRTSAYEIALFSPPGSTQSVSYRVTDLTSGAEATGAVTTDIAALSTAVAPHLYMSVGGTSSVIGIKIFSHYIETDY